MRIHNAQANMAAVQGDLLFGESGRDYCAWIHWRVSPIGSCTVLLEDNGSIHRKRCTRWKGTFAAGRLLDQIYAHNLAQKSVRCRYGQVGQHMSEYETILAQI
jgi:hypothetical protein